MAKETQKKILLSGVKPTGRPHIGNYFGAMKQFVDLQNEFSGLYMLADYHALNFIQNKKEMEDNIIDLALDYLAIGLDQARSIIFRQSDVSAHTELTWVFDTITTMPYLMRAHAFKDAEAKNKEISVGTFNYPILMAADILLYDTDIVPVGQDQKQHVEYTRDIAMKFNNVYGETFKLPEAFILPSVQIVPGTDGQKMSKSYKNTIPLFGSEGEIRKAVMGIVTDSGSGVPVNVRAIHELFRDKNYLDALYAKHQGKYKDLKEALLNDIESFIKPLREKRALLAKDKDGVLNILKKGGEAARSIAEKKMEIVKEKIGLKIY